MESNRAANQTTDAHLGDYVAVARDEVPGAGAADAPSFRDSVRNADAHGEQSCGTERQAGCCGKGPVQGKSANQAKRSRAATG